MSARRSFYTAAGRILGMVFLLVGVSCNKTNPVGGNNGQLQDADGNVYTTVKIGSQEWSAENLRTTKFNDGTQIPLVTDGDAWEALTTPGYCYYNNTTNSDSIKKFGALYNWYAVNTGKLAQAGWHVASDSDWSLMANYLSGNANSYADSMMWRIGKAIAAKTDWAANLYPGTIGNDLTTNNSSGFSALPGGSRSSGHFGNNIGFAAHWWTSTPAPAGGLSVIARSMSSTSPDLVNDKPFKPFGFSVRLVRD
jgi:uncharacterized protein (TIGR02145 family)